MDFSGVSPSNALELRPLRTSELLDRTFQLYRRYFVSFFLLAAIIYSVNFGLGLVSEYLRGGRGYFNLTEHPVTTLVVIMIGLVSMLILEMGSAAMSVYVSDLYLGRPQALRHYLLMLRGHISAITFSSLLKWTFISLSFVPAVAVFAALSFFWSRLSLLPLLLASGGGLLLVLPGLILTVRYLLTTQLIMLEQESVMGSLRRSSTIARYNPGLGFWYWGATRLSLILLLLVVISGLIGALSATPLIIAHLAEHTTGLDAPSTLALSPVMILTHLLNYLGNAVVAPLYVIGVILFYYDVRVRKEGLDLQLLVTSLNAHHPL
jgi:hypothetical protein